MCDPLAADILAPLTEITTGCRRICGRVPLYVTAFCTGFGGIAVHFQIFAQVKDLPVNKTLFFLIRVMQGIFTMGAAYIFLMISPMEQAVFSTTVQPLSASGSATLAGSGALILLSLCFIGSVNELTRQTAEDSGAPSGRAGSFDGSGRLRPADRRGDRHHGTADKRSSSKARRKQYGAAAAAIRR